MIEKLKRPVKIGGTTFREKINELVDAVNGLQEAFESIHPCLKYKDLNKTPADPYAEQRKWIGKLCKFRDNYEDKWHFGVLEEIYERSDFPFGDFDNFEWAICEPVKPDDNIIYKGDKDE